MQPKSRVSEDDLKNVQGGVGNKLRPYCNECNTLCTTSPTGWFCPKCHLVLNASQYHLA